MEQTDVLRHVVETLDRLEVSYMLVGSFASGAWGEPRFTQDIDVVVSLMADDVPALTRAFPSPEYSLSPEAAREAIRQAGQFNIIHPASGNKIDVMVARKDPYWRQQLARRRRVAILPDLEAYVAAPEDVILGKMLYYHEGGSEKHLRDITGILEVAGEQVDREYVATWAQRLGLKDVWDAIVRRLGMPPDQGEQA